MANEFIKNIVKSSLRETTSSNFTNVISEAFYEFDNPLSIKDRKKRKMQNILKQKQKELKEMEDEIPKLKSILKRIESDNDKVRKDRPDDLEKFLKFSDTTYKRTESRLKDLKSKIASTKEEMNNIISQMNATKSIVTNDNLVTEEHHEG